MKDDQQKKVWWCERCKRTHPLNSGCPEYTPPHYQFEVYKSAKVFTIPLTS